MCIIASLNHHSQRVTGKQNPHPSTNVPPPPLCNFVHATGYPARWRAPPAAIVQRARVGRPGIVAHRPPAACASRPRSLCVVSAVLGGIGLVCVWSGCIGRPRKGGQSLHKAGLVWYSVVCLSVSRIAACCCSWFRSENRIVVWSVRVELKRFGAGLRKSAARVKVWLVLAPDVSFVLPISIAYGGLRIRCSVLLVGYCL